MKYRRVVISRRGGPEVLQVVEEELLEPGAGEVRVKIFATGVAFADMASRRGMYPTAPPIPFAPGYDIVGVVEGVGGGVSSLAEGQTVAALLPHFGGYAEFANVPENLLLPVPDGLDPAETVSVVLNYLTAHRLLHRSARVTRGERILVHGAAGGVGTALLQMGKEASLEMYGTASRDKHALVSGLGATPIDHRGEDFIPRIRDLTGSGVDAVFDGIGGKNLTRSYRTLRRGGRLISFGFIGAFQRNKRVEVPLSIVRLFLLRIIPDGKKALFYGDTPSFVEKDNAWYREALAALLKMLAEGKIKPVVGERIPLVEAARAHKLMERASVSGKIVLICNEP
ncbi:MAG: medium chain dehydrogenase/reductase family protein [Dehalococcoidia bacterium]